MDFKDYYKTLGVQPNASLETIRTAYRKLSKKFHPDMNNGDHFFANLIYATEFNTIPIKESRIRLFSNWLEFGMGLRF